MEGNKEGNVRRSKIPQQLRSERVKPWRVFVGHRSSTSGAKTIPSPPPPRGTGALCRKSQHNEACGEPNLHFAVTSQPQVTHSRSRREHNATVWTANNKAKQQASMHTILQDTRTCSHTHVHTTRTKYLERSRTRIPSVSEHQ